MLVLLGNAGMIAGVFVGLVIYIVALALAQKAGGGRQTLCVVCALDNWADFDGRCMWLGSIL